MPRSRARGFDERADAAGWPPRRLCATATPVLLVRRQIQRMQAAGIERRPVTVAVVRHLKQRREEKSAEAADYEYGNNEEQQRGCCHSC